MASLAERLAEALRKNNLSARKAAKLLKAEGFPISHGYISKLSKGTAIKPSLAHMEALAELLGVSVGWLAGEDPKPERALSPEEEQQLAEARRGMEELGVTNIAERMTGLSDLSVAAIAQMVEAMRRAENLDNRTDPGSETDDKS